MKRHISNILLLFLLPSFVASIAVASESEAIPWKNLIIPQLVNFCLFFGLLYYLLHKPVQSFFASRIVQFEAAAQEAGKAKASAQQAHDAIKTKIQEVETAAQTELAKAKSDAAIAAQKSIEEAKAMSKRLEAEARAAAQQELYRSVSMLKTEFLMRSFGEAETYIKANVDETSDKKMQKHFMDKAKSVRA